MIRTTPTVCTIYSYLKVIRKPPMREPVIRVGLLLLLTACNSSTGTPTLVTPTSAVAVVETPTPMNFEERLFDYDLQEPVVVTENSAQQENGYTLYDISYASPKGGNVPAYLLIPDGAGPFAGLILMHGSSGSRENLLPFAKDLVLTGAAVLTISGPSARTPNRDWIHFTPQDRAEQIQLIIDLRRGVDVLVQHTGVDPSRIGYIGYSYGAAMGGLLAGVEPRIKAYGLMVGDGGLVNHFMDGDKPMGGFETIPSDAREVWLNAMSLIEPINFVDQAAPSALFFQSARRDSLVTEEDALAYQTAGSEPKRVEWYDSGHGLPPQAYFDMVDWLAEQIGIDASQFQGPSS